MNDCVKFFLTFQVSKLQVASWKLFLPTRNLIAIHLLKNATDLKFDWETKQLNSSKSSQKKQLDIVKQWNILDLWKLKWTFYSILFSWDHWLEMDLTIGTLVILCHFFEEHFRFRLNSDSNLTYDAFYRYPSQKNII